MIKNSLKPIKINEFLHDEDLSVQDIINLNNGNVEIKYDPVTGFPREIKGKYTTRKIFEVQDSVKSLSSVRTIMHINELTFACIEEEKRENKKLYRLQQLYKNIPVYGAEFFVIINNNGEPIYLNGTYITIISLEAKPKITAKEAKKNIILQKGMKIINTDLIIYPISNKDNRLSWKLTIKAKTLQNYKFYFIDANTNELLGDYPLAIFNANFISK